MEALYAKLYNKYTKLKKEKETQLDKLNRDQEEKFLNFVAAADEMIQYLKSENERLNGQVDELKSELASIRSSSAEQHIHLEKLLMEENQKNKELSEEIASLQNLEHNKYLHSVTHEKIGQDQENSHDDAPRDTISKKRKSVHSTEGMATTHVDVELDPLEDQHASVDKGTSVRIIQQPVCCQRKIFSSGYSFSLTWITNPQGEVELLYRVVSMGTFERVAPEWMKETLMFSTNMCGVFFDRVSRIVKS